MTIHDNHVRPGRRTTPVLLAALAAATLAAAPAPVGSTAAAPAPASGTGPADAAVMALDGVPVRTLRGLASRQGFMPGDDPRDLAAWARADRRLLEASGLRTLGAADACLGESFTMLDEDCGPIDGDPDEMTFTFAGPLGDLDGDGFEDVVVETVTFGPQGERSSSEARSGSDGTSLWSLDRDGYAFSVGIPDVDGDGGQDVLELEYAESEFAWSQGCTPLRCTYSESFDGGVAIRLRSGSTAALLHERVVDFRFGFDAGGTWVDEAGTFVGVFDDRFEVVGDITALAVVGVGPDGGASPRLLLGTADAEADAAAILGVRADEASYDAVMLMRSAEQRHTQVVLIEPVTGEVTTLADTDDDGRLSFVTPVRLDGRDALVVDAVDSASRTDVVACLDSMTLGPAACEGTSSIAATQAPGTRTLVDADLTPRWEVPLPANSWFVHDARGDVDGDGRDDLLDARFDPETGSDVTALIDGATGETRWSAPVLDAVARDGALLAVRFVEREREDGFEIDAEALRLGAADGAVLDARSVASVRYSWSEDGATEGWIGVGLVPLVGDAPDVMAEEYEVTYVSTGDGEEYCETWEDPETGEIYEECWTEGSYELVDQRAVLRGVSGDDLSTVFEREMGDGWVLGVVDLDADGVREVLRATFDQDGVVTSAERLDGTVMWQLRGEYVGGVLATPGPGVQLVVHDLDGGVAVVDAVTLEDVWRIGALD